MPDRSKGVFALMVLVLAIAGVSTDTSSNETQTPACSDGIDNDGDGLIDANLEDPSITDPECEFENPNSLDPFGNPMIQLCVLWDSETVAPTTEAECNGE